MNTFPIQLPLQNNVFYYSYDADTVDIQTHGNTVRGNLAFGMFKEMSGEKCHETRL